MCIKKPKLNRYVLNYVISTTHSFHIYSMWGFTHTCIPNRENFKNFIIFQCDLNVEFQKNLLSELLWKKEEHWWSFWCFVWWLECSQTSRERRIQILTNATILASKHVMLIRWVVLASRKHAPAAMTLVNLKKMEKHVFCFGAGKYNNVAMVIIIWW